MIKKLTKTQQYLKNYRLKWGVYKKEGCTEAENAEFKALEEIDQPLPDDIHSYLDEGINNYEPVDYYRIVPADLTEAERKEFLTYKKLELLEKIKGCAYFFVALAVLSLIGAVVALIITLT